MHNIVFRILPSRGGVYTPPPPLRPLPRAPGLARLNSMGLLSDNSPHQHHLVVCVDLCVCVCREKFTFALTLPYHSLYQTRLQTYGDCHVLLCLPCTAAATDLTGDDLRRPAVGAESRVAGRRPSTITPSRPPSSRGSAPPTAL